MDNIKIRREKKEEVANIFQKISGQTEPKNRQFEIVKDI